MKNDWLMTVLRYIKKKQVTKTNCIEIAKKKGKLNEIQIGFMIKIRNTSCKNVAKVDLSKKNLVLPLW